MNFYAKTKHLSIINATFIEWIFRCTKLHNFSFYFMSHDFSAVFLEKKNTKVFIAKLLILSKCDDDNENIKKINAPIPKHKSTIIINSKCLTK